MTDMSEQRPAEICGILANLRSLMVAVVTLVLTAPPRYALGDLPPRSLSVHQAVTFALSHHPSLKACTAIEAMRTAQTTEAKMAMLPRLDVGAQWSRATGNVVVGTVFALPGMPAVSGPPLPEQFDGGVFGSSVSLSTGFDVAGLPQRMAQLDAALAEQSQAQAATEVRKLDVAYVAADSYLQVWAAMAIVQAAQASVERAKILTTMAESYQRAELRPGADVSRARAELALAEVQHSRAKQSAAVARMQLAQALGIAGTTVEIMPMNVALLPAEPASNPAPFVHPVLRESQRAVQVAESQLRATRMQYLPRLELVAALWSRGSGLGPSSVAGGLIPDVANWGVGLVLSWPILESFAVRARVKTAMAKQTLILAQQEEATQAIRTQVDAARATLTAAHAVLEHTPSALQAARATEQQALARYKAGLVRILDVADAQRLLAQTETEDALARINILRARLLLARSLGDLSLFLDAQQSVKGVD